MNSTIAEKFQIEGQVTNIKPFGSGHINDTYCVCIDNKPKPSFILQQINTNVFLNIEILNNNILITTKHLLSKNDSRFEVMTLVSTHDGKYWYQNSDGKVWRMLTYISDSKSFDLAPSPKFAYQAGLAYGWFIKSLADLPAQSLSEVIPNFHSLKHRINQLNQAIDENRVSRLINCKNIVDFYLDRYNEIKEFDGLVNTHHIPLRITHNDTKINNVLFDSNGKAISVIDLDTVMPGVVHYDFGDAIRTIAATALEDETNLGLVGINLELYKNFANGFLKETKEILTKSEIEYLPESPKIMAFIMGIRFLADYLRGDTYYKVKHHEHNIQRAMNQMAMIKDIERKMNKMQDSLFKIQ